MTPEESLQVEHIKKHGMHRPNEKKSVPIDKRYGWWRIKDIIQWKQVLDSLHVRGKRIQVEIIISLYVWGLH